MRRAYPIPLLAASVLSLLSQPARAQVPSGTTRIEEDWKVVIATPDSSEQGPQIFTAMSPNGDIQGTPYFMFNVNFRDVVTANPRFTAGGVQVQCWSGLSELTGGTATLGTAQLNTSNETITWTQRMRLTTASGVNTLRFSIATATSTTWGSFGTLINGSNCPLSYNYANPGVASFAAYTPAFSAANSQVSWQKQNVSSMVLLQVRYYDANDKLLATDTTQRTVAP